MPHQLSVIQRLSPLFNAWSNRYPNRAAGGRRALAGFDTQFLMALLETVNAWLDNPDVSSPAVFCEWLSDHVSAHNDLWVVTQVKRTLNARALREALEELYLIYDLACTVVPQEVQHLRFRIQTTSGDLVSIQANIRQWATAGPAERARSVEVFQQYLEIDIQASPRTRLLELLANRLRATDPLSKVRKWSGQLLELSRGRSFDLIAEEIWNDLQALQRAMPARQAPPGVYLWTDADQPPSEIQAGDYLTGERPRPEHLRKGFFASRPDVYDALYSAFTEWTVTHPATRDKVTRLPVFWIGGRSGTGKSVALLHLLAQLQATTESIVLWIGNRVDMLAPALRWSSALTDGGDRVIIGVDDPYSPNAQQEAEHVWSIALNEMEAWRSDPTRVEEIPIIVCCGPSEQAARMAADFPDDILLETDAAVLPFETPDELARLGTWFERRSGHAAPMPNADNMLLVQLFFEWHTGHSLSAFAHRFRKRLRAIDHSDALIAFFAKLLALNRMYAGYAAAAADEYLTPLEQDQLDRLRSELHLTERSPGGREGLWLAHPHLATQIYETWYPTSTCGAQRRAHLEAAVMDCLRFGNSPREQMAPIWALANIVRQDRPDEILEQRVQRRDAAHILQRLYEAWVKLDGGRVRLSQLAAWIQVQASQSDFVLEPDPIALTIRSLSTSRAEETGAALCCHKLLEYYSKLPLNVRGEVIEAVRALLVANPRWPQWSAVAKHALASTGADAIYELVKTRVTHETSGRERGALVEAALLQGTHASMDRRAWAEQAIDGADASLEWLRVCEILVSEGGAIPQGVIGWVARHYLSKNACFLLRRLLDMGMPGATEMATRWLERWGEAATANFVLEPLLRANPNSSVLRECAMRWIGMGFEDSSFLLETLICAQDDHACDLKVIIEWLGARSNHVAWSRVFMAAWLRWTGEEELREQATQWLTRQHADGKAIGFIWTTLWKQERTQQLYAFGRNWLCEVNKRHGSWGYVWQALWDHASSDELAKVGLEWLMEVERTHASWGYVWQALWKHSSSDELIKNHVVSDALAKVGLEWLMEVERTHVSWSYVWQALWKHSSSDELAKAGLEWLMDAERTHASWGYVWRALWSHASSDELAKVGLEWLVDAERTHASWGYVWQALWKHASSDELAKQHVVSDALAKAGLEWLMEVERTHASWGYVWQALWQDSPSPELASIGGEWLVKARGDHGSWGYVWLALWRQNAQEELFRVGLQWLSETDQQHGSWSYVWEGLWQHHPTNELAMMGLVWLRGAHRKHGSWTYVWQGLWQHHPTDELAMMGLAWLKDVDKQHGSWGYAWQALWPRCSSNELAKMGLEWLRGADIEHVLWGDVWQALWAEGASAELASRGLQWLKSAPKEHPAWQYIWSKVKEVDELRGWQG